MMFPSKPYIQSSFMARILVIVMLSQCLIILGLINNHYGLRITKRRGETHIVIFAGKHSINSMDSINSLDRVTSIDSESFDSKIDDEMGEGTYRKIQEMLSISVSLIPHTPHAGAQEASSFAILRRWFIESAEQQTQAQRSPFVIISILREPPVNDTVPADHEINMQRLAITSWLKILSPSQIRVWMDTSEGCDRASLMYSEMKGIRCSPLSFSSEYGKPMMDAIWREAKAEFPDKILMSVNGDIIITDKLFKALDAAYARFPNATIICRRTDFNLSSEWTPNDNLNVDINAFTSTALKDGILHDPIGIDLFAVPADSPVIRDFPPFLVGVYRWDNWLLFTALVNAKVPVVDITAHGALLHAVMEYNKGLHANRRGAPYNDALCKKHIGELYKVGSAINADYILPDTVATARTLHHHDSDFAQFVANPLQSATVPLARRVGSSGWLVVVTVSEGYLPQAYQWLCHVRRAGVGYYVFLAQDEASRRALTDAGEPVLNPADFNVTVGGNGDGDGGGGEEGAVSQGAAGAAEYGSLAFQDTMTLRTLVLKELLRAGFNVITADLDSIWLGDPLEVFSPTATVQGQEHKLTKMSGGFVAIRAGEAGRRYWHLVCECQRKNMEFLRAAAPGTYEPSKYTEQECVNDVARDLLRRNTSNFTVHILSSRYLPDGRSFFDEFKSARQGVLPLVVHNNWIKGGDAKLDRLRRTGLFFDGSDFRTCPPHPLRPTHALRPSLPGGDINDVLSTPSDSPAADAAAAEVGGEESAGGRAVVGALKYRIHIITLDRPQSLRRLLDSLMSADYSGGDGAAAAAQVSVVFLIDHPWADAGPEVYTAWEETKAMAAEFRLRPEDPPAAVVAREANAGLLAQWMDTWAARDPNEILVVFEDDIEVSPGWFRYVSRAAERYYGAAESAGGDASLAGLGLQKQHTILGQRPDLRYPAATPAELLPPGAELFRYQLLSTWGSVWFPHAWSEFRHWLRHDVRVNLTTGLPEAPGPGDAADAAGSGSEMEGVGGADNLNQVAGAGTRKEPCVPTLISNDWWKSKPARIWSVWMIRFAFERGYYFLYTNLPGGEALVANYRESGLHFSTTRGADSNLTASLDHLSLPDLDHIPLYDLHFRPARSAESLRWHARILSPDGLDRCTKFNKTLADESIDRVFFGIQSSAPPPGKAGKAPTAAAAKAKAKTAVDSEAMKKAVAHLKTKAGKAEVSAAAAAVSGKGSAVGGKDSAAGGKVEKKERGNGKEGEKKAPAAQAKAPAAQDNSKKAKAKPAAQGNSKKAAAVPAAAVAAAAAAAAAQGNIKKAEAAAALHLPVSGKMARV